MALTAGSIEIKLFADLARLQSDMNKANKTVDTAMRNIDKSVGMAKRAFGSITTSFGLAQVAKLADEYKKFDSQLQLSTKNLNDYTAAYENVIRIGKTAQSDIGAIGVLYARLNNNLRDVGITQAQVANTTETISLALRTNNATVQETNSVMLQLSQSFGSGKLNGQEFLAVAEGAPLLLRQLAKSMGVPFGALKDLSSQGKITREELLKAFSDPEYLASLRNQVKQVGTISSAITVLTNNLKQFIGEQDKATGASKIITNVIVLLAENINFLATVALIGLIAATGKWIAGTYASIVASNLRQVELVKETVMIERKAAAEAAAAAVTQAAMANNARATTMWAARNSAAMTEAAAVAGAVAAKTTAVATAQAGLRSAIGFLGGPIGAITTALMLGVTAWMAWGDNGVASANKTAEALGRVNQGMASINDAKLLQLQKTALEAERAKLTRPLSDIESAGARSVYGSNEKANIAKTAALEELNRKINEVDTALKKFNSTQSENASIVDKLAPIYDKYAKAGRILSVEIAEQNQQIADAKALYDANKISLGDYNRMVEEAKKKINDLTGATKANKEAAKEDAKHHADLIKQAIALAEQEKQAYQETQKAKEKSRQESIGNNDELQKEIDKRNEEIGILLNGEDAYAMLQIAKMEETIATVELTIAQAELNSTTADGVKYAQDYLDKLKEELRLKKELREKEAIKKNLENNKKEQLDKERDAIKEVESDYKKLERAIDTMAKNSAAAMTDFITGTQTSFGNMINSMIKDILQLMIYKNITQPIAQAISGSMGGGGFFASLFGGSFAAGGAVNPNHSYMVGERGPEMFVPQTAGSIVPANEIGNSQAPVESTPPTVNIKNVNVLDPSLIGDYLNTDNGERLIMNTIQRNRAALGI